jgi:phage terminase large subunit-like protein
VRNPDLTKARAVARKGGWDPGMIRDAHDVRAVLDGCIYEHQAGQRVLDFFSGFLRHSKSTRGTKAGEPFDLLPWQEDITRRLFGWKRKDGTRRYRKAYIEVAKKNGKSTWMSGLELYLLLADDEPSAEVYCGATDKNQAGIVFNECVRMIQMSPDLLERLGNNISETKKTVADLETMSTFGALSADVPSKEGLNIHAAVIDELHAHKSRALFSTLVYGGAARRQPLFIAITTAGVYDPLSIGWEQHEYARKVLADQIHDWAYLAAIYAVDKDDDWQDPTVWPKANPSWGVTIDPETFAHEAREAAESPQAENDFRRYRLNQWTQQAVRAIPLELWDQNAGHAAPMVALHGRGRACDAALDLSSVSDLSAFVAAFECDEDPEAVDLFARFWVPDFQLTNRKNPNAALYQQWVDAGYLVTTPGNSIDYDAIIRQVLEDATSFALRDLNIDRLFQGQHVYNRLADEGMNVFPWGQGFIGFGPPMKEFNRRLLGRRLHHGNHPILRWMADNVVTVKDSAGNEKMDKQKSPQKIDGMVCIVGALDRLTRHAGHEEEGADAYNDEGIFTI